MSVRDLINNYKPAIKAVEIDGFGTVHLKRLPANVGTDLYRKEREQVKQANGDLDVISDIKTTFTRTTVGLSVCEADGSAVFKPENDYVDVLTLDFVTINAIYKEVLKHNTPKQQVEDEKKE